MSQPELMAAVAELRRKSQRFLLDVGRGEDGMFPYSTSVRDGSYVNRFDHPQTARYSINSLLGLQKALRTEPGQTDATSVNELTQAFLAAHASEITNPADLGLLLVLLCEAGLSEPLAVETLARVRAAATGASTAKLTMQELAWMLWGSCSAAHAGLADAEATASTLFRIVESEFADPDTGLPRHSTSRYRRGVVSFGAVVYYLRALHEYARLTGERRAVELFAEGVRRIVAIQGEQGEWPWMIGVRSGRPLDFYPVFAVHQDSMAMLFLLPALGDGHDVARAIDTSLAWVFGANELGLEMTEDDPFVAYRSIERVERIPRARRYLRASGNAAAGRSGRLARGRGVRLNPDCRSYHLGWIVYAWSGVASLSQP